MWTITQINLGLPFATKLSNLSSFSAPFKRITSRVTQHFWHLKHDESWWLKVSHFIRGSETISWHKSNQLHPRLYLFSGTLLPLTAAQGKRAKAKNHFITLGTINWHQCIKSWASNATNKTSLAAALCRGHVSARVDPLHTRFSFNILWLHYFSWDSDLANRLVEKILHFPLLDLFHLRNVKCVPSFLHDLLLGFAVSMLYASWPVLFIQHFSGNCLLRMSGCLKLALLMPRTYTIFLLEV